MCITGASAVSGKEAQPAHVEGYWPLPTFTQEAAAVKLGRIAAQGFAGANARAPVGTSG